MVSAPAIGLPNCRLSDQRLLLLCAVVEPGDSTEDREARALLNKFLGASVIMQGVESMLPAGQRQQQLSRGNISSSQAVSDQPAHPVSRP